MDASVNRIPSSKDEKTLLLALKMDGDDLEHVKYSLEELVMLVKTAGAITVDSRIVNRSKIDASFIIGKGFLDEISKIIKEKKIKLIVFDLNNIRPAQVRNLEEKLKCRVVGRNEVIMDIFARRARSTESKIEVELAQLQYILPRLKGLGGVLSKLAGGIGSRGPGEKMLETDRRHIQRKITTLKRKLVKIKKHRERTRQSRLNEFRGAVVGYTNAGKSTLVNKLAKDDLFVENRLFATLESYTRVVFLEHKKKALLSDTVGFIRNLPANLIESFRSTLEEIAFSTFVIHVVDITAPDIDTNIETVNLELIELESLHKPTILFFNKSDLLEKDGVRNHITAHYPDAIIGSVITGEGIDLLRQRILGLYNEFRI